MVLSLKVKLLDGPCSTTNWEAIFEVEPGMLLEELHALIQSTINFDDDHLYEFFIARTEKSRDRQTFDDENGGLYETCIDDLFPLPEKRQLFYLFDYGDYWLFKITKPAQKTAKPSQDVEYPRLIQESGRRPIQYPSADEDDA